MNPDDDLIVRTAQGLYCPAGDFHIDPWRPVARAVITHAHADHARAGSASYLCAAPGAGVLKARLGGIDLQSLPYGQTLRVGDAQLSLHPAGHVLGSAQVRVAHRGRVWVASGDYFCTGDAGADDRSPGPHDPVGLDRDAANPGADEGGAPMGAVERHLPQDLCRDDRTCEPFEPVRCDTFITESTFGLPVYRWRPRAEVFAQINAWWAGNAADGRPSLLLAYSFGKAQRLLAGVDASIGAIVVHGAVEPLNAAYRAAGVALPPTLRLEEVKDKALLKRALVIAPPSVRGSAWARRLGEHSDAFASGWMQLRGMRRRQGLDRGFVLSDHADWPGLQRAIAATGAQRVIVTHGYEAVMVRWLREQGLQAGSFETAYGQEDGAEASAAAAADAPAAPAAPAMPAFGPTPPTSSQAPPP